MVDLTNKQYFLRDFMSKEVDLAKQMIKAHISRVKGLDDSRNVNILEIPSKELSLLFNSCICDRGVPLVWLTTMLVGIAKAGKLKKEANNYRIIALECFEQST